ncbi:MAG: DUF1304 domain-containing protein [Pasteurellaceae bacterium]|nr:DUF1304 domain-containing protein [Pasteurellaceae bacterium]
MIIIAYILTALVALEHFYILYLEMFAIESRTAKRVFALSNDFLRQDKVKVMFANQGLYNGFLGAGIVFGFCIGQLSVIYFFLICVLTAAIYGSITANKSILFKQGLPAVLALLCYFI